MIKGNRIYLRAVEPEDIDIIFAFENDEEYWKVSETTEPLSRFSIEQYVLTVGHDIYTSKELKLMICRNEDHKCIGSLDLFQFDPHHKRAGIGILIDRAFQNQGFASEALDLLLNFSFKVLQLHQLFCNILSDNQVSLSLFQSRDFNIIGIKKDWRLINNEWVDELFLQKINS